MAALWSFDPLTRKEYEDVLKKLQGGLAPGEKIVFHRGLSIGEYAESIQDSSLGKLILEINKVVHDLRENERIITVQRRIGSIIMHGDRKMSEPAEITRGVFEQIAIGKTPDTKESKPTYNPHRTNTVHTANPNSKYSLHIKK